MSLSTKIKNQKPRIYSGFTLIELLVVIAIIGILSSVILVNLSNTRLKARDAKRVSDLSQIKKALEIYYSYNGAYPIPVSGGPWATSHPSTTDPAGVHWASLETLLSPYLSKLPKDPKGPIGFNGPWAATGQNNYFYRSNGTIYDLIAQLEDASNPNRCEVKQYIFHMGTIGSFGPPAVFAPGDVWCGPSNSLIYADH